MRRMDVIARCLRGVEWITAAEARGRLGATVEHTRHREVWLRAGLPAAAWTSLRTADDVFLHTGVGHGIGPTRPDLRTLVRAAAGIDWAGAAAAASRPAGAFDVVASFLGKRNYNRFEVEDAIGEQIAGLTGWRQRRRSPTGAPAGGVSLTVRVHIEGDEAVFGVRLADRPLHRRPWKVQDVAGTLHPPLAAAMGLVAGLRAGLVLADPCCGAGTVAIEAALEEPSTRLLLGDLDPSAVRATGANLAAAGVAPRALVVRSDAGALPARRSSLDRIVTNAPWGRAVAPAGRLRHGWDPLVAQMAAALDGRGRAALLVDPAEVDALAARADPAGLAVVDAFSLSVSGAWAAMVVVAGPRSPVIDPGARFGTELAGGRAAALSAAGTR